MTGTEANLKKKQTSLLNILPRAPKPTGSAFGQPPESGPFASVLGVELGWKSVDVDLLRKVLHGLRLRHRRKETQPRCSTRFPVTLRSVR